MTRTILAVLAVLTVGCGRETGPARQMTDAAALDTTCPTLVGFDRPYTYDLVGGARLDFTTHVTCPPEARMSVTVADPSAPFADGHVVGVIHCAWTCVAYACAAGQDVRVDFDGTDSSVLSITHSASADCAQ